MGIDKDRVVRSLQQLSMLIQQYQHARGKDLYHYTIWSSLAKMMKPVALEYDGVRHDSRMLWLSSANRTNDRSEGSLGESVFIASFSRMIKENVAMWTNYGIPKYEAVRIRLNDVVMQKWYENLQRTKHVYRINTDSYGIVSYTPIEEVDNVDIQFGDVQYWDGDAEGFDRQVIGDNLVRLTIGGKRYDVDASSAQAFLKMKSGTAPCDACFRKKRGWVYEKEARIVIRLKSNVCVDRIAVEFNEPLEAVLNNPSQNIQRGPWYSSSRHYDEIEGVSIRDTALSEYQDEINMRSICSGCDKIRNCICERREN